MRVWWLWVCTFVGESLIDEQLADELRRHHLALVAGHSAGRGRGAPPRQLRAHGEAQRARGGARPVAALHEASEPVVQRQRAVQHGAGERARRVHDEVAAVPRGGGRGRGGAGRGGGGRRGVHDDVPLAGQRVLQHVAARARAVRQHVRVGVGQLRVRHVGHVGQVGHVGVRRVARLLAQGGVVAGELIKRTFATELSLREIDFVFSWNIFKSLFRSMNIYNLQTFIQS